MASPEISGPQLEQVTSSVDVLRREVAAFLDIDVEALAGDSEEDLLAVKGLLMPYARDTTNNN